MSETDAHGVPVEMQLNQVPMGPGGNNGNFHGPYLASSPAQKKKAADSIEKYIEPDTRKAGDVAEESTGAAVKAFAPKDGEGWLTSGALKAAHKTWEGQVKALLNRLSGEKASLRATNTLLGGTDIQVGADSKRIPSALDGY